MTDEKDTGDTIPATNTNANEPTDTATPEKQSMANGGSGERDRDIMTSTMTDATDCDEKPELTRFGKFCARRGINSNLIMLKITLFVMYGGKWFDVGFQFGKGRVTMVGVDSR